MRVSFTATVIDSAGAKYLVTASLVPRPIPSRGETAWYRLFAHAQEFRLFYGYFTVYFTTNDGQNPVLWTCHSTASSNLNTKQFRNQPERTKMTSILTDCSNLVAHTTQ